MNPISVDSPRAIVQVNGQQVPFIDIQISSSGYYTSDLWRVTIPTQDLQQKADASVFLSSADVQIKIYVGYPKNPESYNISDLEFVIEGNADKIDVDFLNSVITASGRDFSSFFIDSAIDQSQFLNVNATASQIVQNIVESKKLKFVGTATNTPLGKFFYDSYFFQPTLKTNWDLMTALAESENYNLYVKGDTVYFTPKSTKASYIIKYTDNPVPTSTTITLEVSRVASLSKSVVVNVLSYNQQTKALNTASAQQTGLEGDQTLGRDPVVYEFSIPNLSPSQCTQKAQSLLNDILVHCMQLTFMSHGDMSLTREQVIKLTGTNTIADQDYYPYRIIHELSNTSGLLTTVYARNYPAQVK